MSGQGWVKYRDFVLRIESAGPGQYRIEAEGPGGEAETVTTLPFDEKDLKIFLLEVGRPRQAVSRGRVPEPMRQTVDFGGKLYNAVLSGPVRDVFTRARQVTEQNGEGLRLQLRLADCPELASLPWEFLYDGRDFLALSYETPVVRYLELPNPPRPTSVELPMRILVTISSPHDLAPLDVDAERAKIEQSLAGLVERGLVEVQFTDDATLHNLQRTLRRARVAGKPFHVWHYIGHGTFDPNANASVLAFCDRNRMSYLVGGFQLGTLFNSYPEMRLGVLNACEGARASEDDPFAGVSAALVERGIPAVIGMQFEISDDAAIAFAGEFYTALVDGLPVDAALIEARRSVFFLPNWVEWATPVLFMRVQDGRLFDIAAAPPGPARPAASLEITPPKPQRRAAARTRQPAPPAEPAPEPAVAAEPIRIVCTGGPMEGTVFEVTEDVSTIGRSPDSTFTIREKRASRRHAQLERRDGGLWLSDLGSTNGTLVRGELVTEPVRLRDGDEFQIGECVFVASIPDDDHRSAPTTAEGFVDRLARLLKARGYEMRRDLTVAGRSVLLAAKGKSRVPLYLSLDTFFIVAEFESITLDRLYGYGKTAFDFADQYRSSGLLPMIVYPVVLVHGLDPLLAQAIEAAAHPFHMASYEHLVVVDLDAGKVHFSQKTPYAGALNYPTFRETMMDFLGAALLD